MTGLARRAFMRLGALLPAALASPPVVAGADDGADQQALRILSEVNGIPTRLCLPLPAPGRAITWTNENERLRGHPGARFELSTNSNTPARHRPAQADLLHLHQQRIRIRIHQQQRTCDG